MKKNQKKITRCLLAKASFLAYAQGLSWFAMLMKSNKVATLGKLRCTVDIWGMPSTSPAPVCHLPAQWFLQLQQLPLFLAQPIDWWVSRWRNSCCWNIFHWGIGKNSRSRTGCAFLCGYAHNASWSTHLRWWHAHAVWQRCSMHATCLAMCPASAVPCYQFLFQLTLQALGHGVTPLRLATCLCVCVCWGFKNPFQYVLPPSGLKIDCKVVGILIASVIEKFANHQWSITIKSRLFLRHENCLAK